MTKKIKNLIESLRQLRVYDFSNPTQARETHILADKAFTLIFEVGQLNPQLSESDEKVLGYLLEKAIVPLQIHVEHSACLHRTSLDTSILIKRSAIQFLIDNFGHCRNNYDIGNFKDVLKRKNIKETVSILDEIIRDFADVSDSEEGTKIKVTVPHKVPAHHTWWHEKGSKFE